MEQQDSLRSELQNLSRLQTEQVNILKNMSSQQSVQSTVEQGRQTHQQANFNTPGMYQNSAQGYFQNPFPGGPGSNPYVNQYSGGFMSNIANGLNGQGKYGMLGVMSPGTQSSLTSRTLNGMDYGSRIGQTAMTGVGAAASAGASWGLGAVLPGLAGAGVGMAGGIAAGALVDINVEEMKKNSSLKKYLYKNSDSFINPFETENERGVAGFSMKQSENAADFVRTMNDEMYMKDDDTMMLLQKFTEGGLMKESKDLDSFKEKMTSLTKTVKEGALMLNETYDSIADLMAEMRKAGIDTKNFKDIMGSGNVLGSLFGGDGSDTIRNFLEYIKNLNAGTGNDGDKTFSRLEDTGIYMSQYFDKLKTTKPKDLNMTERSNLNMIENLGGAEEATKYTHSLMEKMVEKDQFAKTGLYFYDWDKEKQEFKFNEKNFDKFIGGDMSLQDMYRDTTKKMQQLTDTGQGHAKVLWDNQSANYFKDSLEDGDMTDFVGRVLKAYTDDPQLKAQGFDTRGILSMMGVKDADNQNLLTGFLGYKEENPGLAGRVNSMKQWQSQTATKLAETPSISEMFSSTFEKGKDWVSKMGVSLDNSMGKLMVDFQDMITGYKPIPKYDKEFTTRSSMDSVSYEDVKRDTKQTTDLLASGLDTLKGLKSSGYEVDDKLYDYINKKFDASDKTVTYGRDVISNWDEVSKDLKDAKDTITDLAKKNDLSETIVAALLKYNQQKPGDALEITTTTEELGKNMFNYGGNQNLALAATVSGDSAMIDRALEKAGYNASSLRTAGAQEKLVNVNLDSLGLNEELLNQVKDIVSQGLKGNTPSAPGATPKAEEIQNKDLREKTNVTAEQLNQIIEDNTRDKPSSKMRGLGQTIMEASEQSGVDAMYLMSHAAWETGWGTSSILNDKYNWFGIGAYNSSPGESAYKFDDTDSGFKAGAEWIAKNYTNEDQETINKMIGVPGHNYAVYDNGEPNDKWAAGMASIMQRNMEKYGIGYGAPGTDTPGGIKTTKETVTKDVNGNNTIEDLMKKSSENLELLKVTDRSNLLSDLNKKLNKSSVDINTINQKELLNGPRNSTDVMTPDFNKDILEALSKEKDEVRNSTIKDIGAFLNKGYEEGKNVNDYNNEVGAAADSFYKENRMNLNKFLYGDKESDGYKAWDNQTASEKNAMTKLLSLIEKFFPEVIKGIENGSDTGIENVIGKDGKNIYNEKEKGAIDAGNINSNGEFDHNGGYGPNGYDKFVNEGGKVLAGDPAEGMKLALEGFDKVGSSKLSTFLDGLDAKDRLVSENGIEGLAERMNGLAYQLEKEGVVKKNKSDDLSGNSMAFVSSLRAAMESGDYSDESDALSKDKGLQKIKKRIKDAFGDETSGDDFIGDLISQEIVKSKSGDAGSDKDRYRTLQAFGSNVLGLDSSKSMTDPTGYNQALMSGADSFYSSSMKQLTSFLGGNKEDDGYKAWAAKSASEKEELMKVLGKLEYGLGVNKDEEGITTVDELMDGKSRDDIHTDQEKYKKQFIHKEKDGSYIYDASKANEDPIDWDQFEEWSEGGGKKRAYGNYSRDIDNLGLSGEGSDVTLGGLMRGVDEQIQKALMDNGASVTKALEGSKKILDDVASSGIGLSKTEKATIEAAGDDKGLLAEANAVVDAGRRGIQNMVQTGDVEGLKKFQAGAEAEGISIDSEIFAGYIKLAEAINKTDVGKLADLKDGLQGILDRASDVGVSALKLAGSSDENADIKGGFNANFQKEVMEAVKSGFEGTDLGDKVSKGELATKDLIDLLASGGVLGETKLDADSLEKLALTMSGSLEKSLEKSFSSEEGRDNIESSETYKEVKDSEIVIKVDGKDTTSTIEEAMSKLSGIDGDLAAVADKTSDTAVKLGNDKEEIIKAVTGGFLEAMDESGEKAKEGADKVLTAAEKSEEAIGTFVTTMEKYDGALNGAITTMQKTIDGIDKKASFSWKNPAGSLLDMAADRWLSSGDTVESE